MGVSEEGGETVDLACIGRALQRLTGEVASLRDDMQVLTAMRLLDEVRATHSQIARRQTGFESSKTVRAC
jgi:hypothetical protein